MHGTNGSGLLDWNDARIFLAVARHGSLRAAGRALGISQPTIGRRIAAFEAVFGGPTLFDRLPEGLRLNEAGAALLPVAEQLEDAALSLERHRAAAASVLSGTVRISVGEWAAAFLSQHVGCSSENPPPTGITLELVETMQTANLARRRAGTYTSLSWVYSRGPYTAGSAPRRVIGSRTRRSRGTFRCPAGSRSMSAKQALRWRSVARTCRCSSPPSAPGRGAGFFRALSRTKTHCSNALPRRCPKPPATIGLSSTATCGVPCVCERLWIGSNPFSEANEIA